MPVEKVNKSFAQRILSGVGSTLVFAWRWVFAFGLLVARLAVRYTALLVALFLKYSWRWTLAFAVLGGLVWTVCFLLLGRLPTSHFWQGMLLMLLMVGALIMARGARVQVAGPGSQRRLAGRAA